MFDSCPQPKNTKKPGYQSLLYARLKNTEETIWRVVATPDMATDSCGLSVFILQSEATRLLTVIPAPILEKQMIERTVWRID